jgi:hypothetical protein
MRGTSLVVLLVACGGTGGGDDDDDDPDPVPPPSCAPASAGSSTIAAPVLAYTLADRFHEAWLGSPAVADLDGDGTMEIVVPRHDQLIVWHADGSIRGARRCRDGSGRRRPADFVLARPGLEVAVCRRVESPRTTRGAAVAGVPVRWQDELRARGRTPMATAASISWSVTPLDANSQRDIVIAVRETVNCRGSRPTDRRRVATTRVT